MWDIFKDWIQDIITAFYNFCGDWGLAIILITVVFRLIITPLMYSQTKSSYKMQKFQPEIEKIKERFPDDPQRQSEETQKIYAESKFNPIMGCIPMFIQIPIFMALFQVLRELGDRIGDTSNFCFYNIIPNLVYTPQETFAMGFFEFLPYLILMLIFAFATFLPMLFQTSGQSEQQKKQTRIMALIMSLMMLWFSWMSPAGVLLFWGASSLIAIAQQQISRKILKAQDEKAAEEALIDIKPVEVNVERKIKKKRQSKKR